MMGLAFLSGAILMTTATICVHAIAKLIDLICHAHREQALIVAGSVSARTRGWLQPHAPRQTSDGLCIRATDVSA